MSERKRVTVLGCGRVGAAMALDLAPDFTVTAVDRDERALAPLGGSSLALRTANLADPAAVRQVIADADLVVGAVPGFMGFATARTVIEAGRDLVDISFFPEDALALAPLAEARGVTAIVDCGVAPGLSNLLLGEAARTFDRVDRFVCYVGGLPLLRTWPWEYKAPFSPIDVLEEYTRPARYVEGGRLVVRPALSEPELRDFPVVGTLEAFNTDGLRSVIATFPQVPAMREMTLRYPGHIEKIRVLRESGFFSTEPMTVGDVAVRPLDLAAQLLFRHWRFGPGEEDVTVFRVEIEGESGGSAVRRVHDLFDRADPATGTLSMARTTGYTCTAAVRLLAGGRFPHHGLFPPELLPGREAGATAFLLAELAARGVRVTSRQEPVER